MFVCRKALSLHDMKPNGVLLTHSRLRIVTLLLVCCCDDVLLKYCMLSTLLIEDKEFFFKKKHKAQESLGNKKTLIDAGSKGTDFR